MPIPLKENANPKPLRIYLLGKRDRKIVDNTFNKLYN